MRTCCLTASALLAGLLLALGGGAEAHAHFYGVGIDRGSGAADLRRAAGAGADVVLLPAGAPRHEDQRLRGLLGSAAAAHIDVIVALPPRDADGSRARLARVILRYGSAPASASIVAWAVADPSPRRLRQARRAVGRAGAGAPVLAATAKLPRGRVIHSSEGILFDPRARTIPHLRERLRDLRSRLHESGERAWIGPIGWSSQRAATSAWAAGPLGQRDKLRRAFRLVDSMPRLEGVIWSRWRDHRGRGEATGLVHRGGRAKPSLGAFRRFAKGDEFEDPASSGPPPPAQDLELGVAPAAEPASIDFELMKRSGVDVVRLTIARPSVQPGRDGDFDWRALDERFAGIARAGMMPLPALIDSPSQAGALSSSPAELAGWQRFVGAAVARYGPGGAFWRDRWDGRTGLGRRR
jgi:hypothetical protein